MLYLAKNVFYIRIVSDNRIYNYQTVLGTLPHLSIRAQDMNQKDLCRVSKKDVTNSFGS